MEENEIVNEEILEAMGISRPVYEEIQTIVGRLPSIDELSTLLAMWRNQGCGQGLLSWLKGQPHSMERHDYLESELEPQSREIKEPRVRECIEIARTLFGRGENSAVEEMGAPKGGTTVYHRGDAIYMVGDVSEFFADSEYGRRYLHLVADPIEMGDEKETEEYITMILESLRNNETIFSHCRIGQGGLFGALLGGVGRTGLGFDILSCREIRLDAFLFGERGVRYIVTLDEPHEDFFLQKLTEAWLNCCFLGRITKNRILVDDMDFGRVDRYTCAE